jgi:hypothetical protein
MTHPSGKNARPSSVFSPARSDGEVGYLLLPRAALTYVAACDA